MRTGFRYQPRSGRDLSRADTQGTSTQRRMSLLVVDPTAPSLGLRAALRDPAVIDGDIYLLAVFPTAEYEARRRARVKANVTAPYTIDHLKVEARRIAQRAGREWLDSTSVEFEPMGAVGRVRDSVRMAVEDLGVTHVYVAATRRTLRQRLLGVEDLSSTLAGVLPTDVTVVPVDGTFDSALDVPARKAVADLVVLPDDPIEK